MLFHGGKANLNVNVRTNVCPECEQEGLILDEDAGEIVCSHCGLVIESTIMDTRPEWTSYSYEDDAEKSRTGSPISYSKYDKGLSSEIGMNKPQQSKKNIVDHYKMHRLRKLNVRIKYDASQRNLSQGMSELDRLCDRLKIPHDLQELASKVYRKALKENLIRGRSIASMVAASLYLALRRANVPRSLKEISDVSTQNKKEIARCYRQLFWRLGYHSTIDDPIHYVSKIATKANISNKTQNEAIDLLQKGRRMNLVVGKDPSGVAGAALYIACVKNSERVTQKKIAEAAGVTEVTIRNRYKSLVKDMNLKIAGFEYD